MGATTIIMHRRRRYIYFTCCEGRRERRRKKETNKPNEYCATVCSAVGDNSKQNKSTFAIHKNKTENHEREKINEKTKPTTTSILEYLHEFTTILFSFFVFLFFFLLEIITPSLFLLFTLNYLSLSIVYLVP